jgi:DNA-binding beta-propeller fold protein YncE/cytochrome c peroxidase
MTNRQGLLILPTIVAAACTAPSGEPARDEHAAVATVSRVPQSPNPYTLFETLQVRPLALSADGKTLFAANTPDNRLEIFTVTENGLKPAGSVVVGLEPIAVAVRSPTEVWVVNHLSDSVSVVTLGGDGPRVSRTLLVGDEPRDIVFAGPLHNLAFITTAHRGQSSPDDPDLFANVGRADVWVFDADNLGTSPGGQRLSKITLFADTPRALAATPDGKTVYAAAFFSGNQTTTVSESAVAAVYPKGMPDLPAIVVGGQIVPQPPTGLVVKLDGAHWVDGTAEHATWDSAVRVNLPDQDVFAIDATATPPVAKANGAIAHVGTTLFNMAVNPNNGKVYVSNTDAHNDVRFEGHTPGFTSVRGNIVDSRISIIDPIAKTVTADNLNAHLDHTAGTGDPTLSVAFPQDLTFSHDGKKLFVAAQGSSKLAIYDTATLEAGNGSPAAANQVLLRGGGPTGVVATAGLAFVLTRFDNGISVVTLGSSKETAHVRMFNPEPASVTAGRQYLYNATLTSALGDQACASCHIGGDFDGLAWDLGNPGAFPLPITALAAQESDIHTILESQLTGLFGAQQIGYIFGAYEPAKGPMTTQSLRGMDNHGAMHWRGDRNGAVQQSGAPFLNASGNPVVSAQPNAGIFDELNAFKSFNVAFPGLVANASQLSDGDMTDFANFALQITYPPNPIRNLDDSLTPTQQAGQAFFFNNQDGQELPSDRFHNCNGCHTLDRNGNLGASPHPGFFGTSGRLSFENESQIFKVPHLRNMYQKVGMYASSPDETHAILSVIPQLNPPVAGVRGFGYQHDGATATIEQFLSAFVFVQTTVPVSFGSITNIPPNPFGIPLAADPSDPLNFANGFSQQGFALRRALASYVLAFDANLRPVVGQQATLTTSNASTVAARLALFEAQAAAGNTDLVVKGYIAGRDAGFVFSNGGFRADLTSAPPLSDAQLRALVGTATSALTFTCVPPGEGFRVGIDRDGDGFADGDELLLKTNPADPISHP